MIDNFYFTQTNIKDFERESTCPFRWKSQWIDKKILIPANEDMNRGKYFEYLMLGASATDLDLVTDLPRLKNGDKSVDQLRIEAQALRGKKLFTPGEEEYLGMQIFCSQFEIRSDLGRKGTLDIVAVEDESKIPWIIDVKCTKDLSSTRTEYSWGNSWEDLDLLQQLHYEALFEELFGVRPKLGLLVFDYSPAKRVEFGEITVSDNRRLDKEYRFKAAEEALSLYDKNGWIKVPSVKECEGCPLICDKRLVGSKLVKKIINY